MAVDLFSQSDDAFQEVLGVVEQAQREVRYLVLDMPVEMIKTKFNRNDEFSGDIYIPKYQRKLRWDEFAMSYFIESVLLRIPIPPLFFYENDGRLEIVDGSQRVRTIASFVADEFQLSGLEKLDVLNGLSYSGLPFVTQRKLLNTPIRTFTMQEDTDGSTRYEMFRRINTSSKRLDDAEIRRGAFHGLFLDLVEECSDKLEFRMLINPYISTKDKKKRGEMVERQELVTRFFVYVNFYQEFVHDVRKFLDQKFLYYNDTADNKSLDSMRQEFNRVITFYRNYQPSAFRKNRDGRIAPRVRFEALAVGAALALRINPEIQPVSFDWINEEPFISFIRTDASNSGPKLRGRIEYVRDKLLENE